MSPNHTLCLYVSYYLARFNELAYTNLEFGNMSETHDRIGNILDTNPHTVKNMRDQFDPLFGHRKGWYQVPLSPSRASIVEALQDLSEPEIRLIVNDILQGTGNKSERERLLRVVDSDGSNDEAKRFILRGPTGKYAEEYFIKHFQEYKNLFDGILVDCRDFGVGYDFRIENATEKYYIEVKGLSEISGGVLFTSKEWIVAKRELNNYFLCIISNIGNIPELRIIRNPTQKLEAKKNIYTSIQISWSITQSQLALIDD